MVPLRASVSLCDAFHSIRTTAASERTRSLLRRSVFPVSSRSRIHIRATHGAKPIWESWGGAQVPLVRVYGHNVCASCVTLDHII